MLASSRTRDPDGHYARLGLEPAAAQSEIAAAFRARARVLHPDVPRTGDAAAFLMLKQAYDTLSNAARRAEYDRRAEALARPAVPEATPYYEEPDADYPADQALAGAGESLLMRLPPLPRLPVALLAGLGIVLGFGVIEAAWHLWSPPRQAEVSIRPNAPSVAPLSPSAHRAVLYGPTPVHLAGVPNFYVVPAASAAVLWRLDSGRDKLLPIAELPPFSTLQAVRMMRQTGMLEVRVTDGGMNGYVAADHLAPGNVLTAQRAYCGYNAGAAPEDGEILDQRGTGDGTLVLDNQAVQPAVVKLRDATGAVALSVFLAPNGHAELSGVPNGTYQPDVAIGELWSRACNGFTSGMRAGRSPQQVRLPATAHVTVAPDANGPGWTEIDEQAFEQE